MIVKRKFYSKKDDDEESKTWRNVGIIGTVGTLGTLGTGIGAGFLKRKAGLRDAELKRKDGIARAELNAKESKARLENNRKIAIDEVRKHYDNNPLLKINNKDISNSYINDNLNFNKTYNYGGGKKGDVNVNFKNKNVYIAKGKHKLSKKEISKLINSSKEDALSKVNSVFDQSRVNIDTKLNRSINAHNGFVFTKNKNLAEKVAKETRNKVFKYGSLGTAGVAGGYALYKYFKMKRNSDKNKNKDKND